MNQITKIVLCLSVLVAAACDSDDSPEPSVAEIAASDANFSILAGALEATGLDATLAGDGPFTVFAPTNAAFERFPAGVIESLDADTLSQILTYHVVAGDVDAATVVGLDSASTVEGGQLGIRIADGTVVLNGATQVTRTDITASNGRIHVLDSVLLPPDIAFPGDIVAAAQAYPSFDTLVDAVGSAGLVGTLQTDNDGKGFTLFAPQNQAFASVSIDLATLGSEDLSDVLLYHVVGAEVEAATVLGMTEATTLQGQDIAIAIEAGTVRLNDSATVVQVNLRTSNGIIHILDSVLLPPQ